MPFKVSIPLIIILGTLSAFPYPEEINSLLPRIVVKHRTMREALAEIENAESIVEGRTATEQAIHKSKQKLKQRFLINGSGKKREYALFLKGLEKLRERYDNPPNIPSAVLHWLSCQKNDVQQRVLHMFVHYSREDILAACAPKTTAAVFPPKELYWLLSARDTDPKDVENYSKRAWVSAQVFLDSSGAYAGAQHLLRQMLRQLTPLSDILGPVIIRYIIEAELLAMVPHSIPTYDFVKHHVKDASRIPYYMSMHGMKARLPQFEDLEKLPPGERRAWAEDIRRLVEVYKGDQYEESTCYGTKERLPRFQDLEKYPFNERTAWANYIRELVNGHIESPDKVFEWPDAHVNARLFVEESVKIVLASFPPSDEDKKVFVLRLIQRWNEILQNSCDFIKSNFALKPMVEDVAVRYHWDIDVIKAVLNSRPLSGLLSRDFIRNMLYSHYESTHVLEILRLVAEQCMNIPNKYLMPIGGDELVTALELRYPDSVLLELVKLRAFKTKDKVFNAMSLYDFVLGEGEIPVGVGEYPVNSDGLRVSRETLSYIASYSERENPWQADRINFRLQSLEDRGKTETEKVLPR